jgi:predicted nucleotidyltransferase
LSSVRVFYPEWSTEELRASLKARLAELAKVLPLERAVLFGSWAAGRATVASDVDLLLVYRGEPVEGAFRKAWEILATPGLELHLYTDSEARSLERTLDRMAEGGITLYP